MMVELLRRKKSHWHAPTHHTMHLTRSLPFFRSAQGSYVHRVRSGHIHFRGNEAKHTSLSFWCGGTGFVGCSERPGQMFDNPPANSPLCATCEGRAIGAGMTESRLICGRVVKFSPHI
jgi:hypothetical protein